jgi:hypothetical protein
VENHEGDADNCEVPTDVLMEFILSGGASVPGGYALDDEGNLRADTTADSERYGEELVERDSEELGQPPEAPEEEGGRGKRRRIANKNYSSSEFWRH